MTEQIDLSVVVTFHNETLVGGPTISAADAAVASARAAGYSVETLMVLDNATPETQAWCAQARFDHWDRIERSEGDLGRVRNAVVPLTKGRFIAFLDADDLFSENWLREGIAALNKAEADGVQAIAHPELNWMFDALHLVFHKPAQDDPLFTPYHFYFMNYYDSLCMAPRACHLSHPYVHRDIPRGLSFQDWQFNIETMAAGWKHINVANTIIFKRRRETSLVMESRDRMAILRPLPAMRVDQIDQLGAPHLPNRDVPDDAPDLSAPEAPLDAHYGRIFAERIAHAKTRTAREAETDPEAYARQAAAFDHAFYLSGNRDILKLHDMDPVGHYMRAFSNPRDPAPWFQTSAYQARYPEIDAAQNPFDHYLSTGKDAGYVPQPVRGFDQVSEVLGLSEADAFALWQARSRDLRARLQSGRLGEMVKKAAEHDPLVEQTWTEALRLRIPPFQTGVSARRTANIWALVQASGKRTAKHVICVNRPRFGAAPRIEGHLAQSLAARDGAEEVVVLITDRSGPVPEGKFPDGVRVIDFDALAPEKRGSGGRRRILVEFIRALGAEAVYNVNSVRLWEALEPYGTALATSTKIFGVLLCTERDEMGHENGYPLKRVYRHFDQLSGILTDSHALAEDLRVRYAMPDGPEGKITILPNPVDPSIAPAPAKRFLSKVIDRKQEVFWAGRLDAQKRVDLVYEIAALLPDIRFRLWGEAVMGGPPLPHAPTNVILEGPYGSFADVPVKKADLWLYTSAWDGVPTMLLEAAMTALPLVGSKVGGTGEVLRDGLARALPPNATAADYANAITATLADPEAREKALKLRKILIAERSPNVHRAILERVLA
ncbi:MAG: glycosyltransferase [Pseudomonadota bacterium]